MSRFSGFGYVVQIFIFGVVRSYPRFRTSFEVEIQYVNSSDHIKTTFKHCHA